MVEAVAPLPVNVLMGSASEFSVADLAGFGVRRVSVGAGLAMVAWESFMQAAATLAEGSFDGLLHGRPVANLNALFATDGAKLP